MGPGIWQRGGGVLTRTRVGPGRWDGVGGGGRFLKMERYDLVDGKGGS